jgi:hypothetical protein
MNTLLLIFALLLFLWWAIVNWVFIFFLILDVITALVFWWRRT